MGIIRDLIFRFFGWDDPHPNRDFYPFDIYMPPLLESTAEYEEQDGRRLATYPSERRLEAHWSHIGAPGGPPFDPPGGPPFDPPGPPFSPPGQG